MEVSCSALMIFLGSEILRNLLVLFGILVAIISVISVKRTAKRKQTADLLFGTRADEQLSTGYKLLQKLHDATDLNMRAFANKEKNDSEETNSIRYVLNHWERVCVGINQEIYDETMLHSSSYSTIINIYDQALPFIQAVRENTGKATYYQELECLVVRWRSKPLAQKKPR
ncbi:DUF4760 domain-containing protein [Pseudomonas syringae]|uniref:DUF4760 domain-containing protein n=1 Tax=Pseudomonas syringae TaxID=317 RepID=UPI000E31DDBD|nr:DUF4760 domain-containing protein [Pseudomonas syringae]